MDVKDLKVGDRVIWGEKSVTITGIQVVVAEGTGRERRTFYGIRPMVLKKDTREIRKAVTLHTPASFYTCPNCGAENDVLPKRVLCADCFSCGQKVQY